MSDVLNSTEIKSLKDLGEKIQMDLACDLNSTGIPCRTDRLEAVSNMIKYISIHGYRVEVSND
jgi:hypothetical protein